MVTLQKYLYGPWEAYNSEADVRLRTWVDVVLHLARSIQEQILISPTDSDLLESLQSAMGKFVPGSTESELLAGALQVSASLKAYRDRVTRTAKAQNHDVFRILATLNEALLLLAAGSTRTVDRLKQLESSLERASTINDFAALKSRLAEILALIREEAGKERSESARDRDVLQEQVKQFRSTAPWFRSELPGREEAVAMFERLLQKAAAASRTPRFYLAVFALGRMREIVRRYGDMAANDLVAELMHRKIQFPDRETFAFRWSPESVVVCLEWLGGPDQLSALIEPQIENPFEHRLWLGSRVASLRIGIHWVVMPLAGRATELGEEIDRFSGGHA